MNVEAWHGIHLSHKKNQWNILVIGNHYVNYQNYQNLMLLTSSDTKRKLMHLFLFTNSAQRELVSICTQSISNFVWVLFVCLYSWSKLRNLVTNLPLLWFGNPVTHNLRVHLIIRAGPFFSVHVWTVPPIMQLIKWHPGTTMEIFIACWLKINSKPSRSTFYRNKFVSGQRWVPKLVWI